MDDCRPKRVGSACKARLERVGKHGSSDGRVMGGRHRAEHRTRCEPGPPDSLDRQHHCAATYRTRTDPVPVGDLLRRRTHHVVVELAGTALGRKEQSPLLGVAPTQRLVEGDPYSLGQRGTGGE